MTSVGTNPASIVEVQRASFWRNCTSRLTAAHLTSAALVLYLAAALLVTIQRGDPNAAHTTFNIFRQSFHHLVAGTNLYAYYPAEQGAGAADLFKYSPTAALLFAPFALLPYQISLFVWSALGALLLHAGLRAVLPRPAADVAALMIFPDLFASMQGVSSNALVAALILLALAAAERNRMAASGSLVVLGTAIKLFPSAGLIFGFMRGDRRRLLLVTAAVALAGVLAPLAVTTPSRLLMQYQWWLQIEHADAADLAFGRSAMRLFRDWIGGTWPNWPVQAAATALLLAPLAVGAARWRDGAFRRHFLALLLMYSVLFNHQAERSSFVIASAGIAIWCLTPWRDGRVRAGRLLLAVPALLGLEALPLLVAWLACLAGILRWAVERSDAIEDERVVRPVLRPGAAQLGFGVAHARYQHLRRPASDGMESGD